MSNESDKADRGSDSAPDAPYKVGNKKPPLHSRFKPGHSGNPSGRPKGRSNFGTVVLKEFHKVIPATINGKPSQSDERRAVRPFDRQGRHYERSAEQGADAERHRSA